MYYKAPDNSLHVIEPQFAYMLPAGSVQITDAEANALRIANLPQPSQAQVIASYTAAVQSHLDDVAVSWNYLSILSAASYAASTVPQFQAEALALIAWRDAVWLDCYTKQAAIQAGTQPIPASPAAFVATLPTAPARPVL